LLSRWGKSGNTQGGNRGRDSAGGDADTLQIHIDFFIALLFDCARMKLRIRHVETRQTLINVIGGRHPGRWSRTVATGNNNQATLTSDR